MTQQQETKDIIFILDESGSMDSMKKEAVQSMNQYIEEQKAVCKEDRFTLWTFNSNSRMIYTNQALESVPTFKEEDYQPRLMTAMCDCIAQAINTHFELNKDARNVTCVILTDGMENASKEYRKKDIKEMINKCEKENGWSFMFLAANQDATLSGNQIGISRGSCLNFSTEDGDIGNAMSTASKRTARRRM